MNITYKCMSWSSEMQRTNMYHSKCYKFNITKEFGFFIWVLFIIHLSFSCPCPILTLHLLLNNLDGLWKSWVQWSSCPGSNGNLSFECLWTSVMLKMVNLKPPNRKCLLCINRRCYTKGLVKIKIKTVKVTWCKAKVKSHLWHPRSMLSSLIPILHNSPSLFNNRRLDNWVLIVSGSWESSGSCVLTLFDLI